MEEREIAIKEIHNENVKYGENGDIQKVIRASRSPIAVWISAFVTFQARNLNHLPFMIMK
jgi:hypothetical protein